jgi:3-dehydroquinate dehydratase-1
MTARKSVKAGQRGSRLVGVVTSPAELRLANYMAQPPDLFELRLDHLIRIEKTLSAWISRLRRPVIITARHPAEGGANNLSGERRRELLSRFLPQARYVDVELRSARALQSVLESARKQHLGCIVSSHYFNSSPSASRLHAAARAAAAHGADMFKVAMRTDTPAQLARLLTFASSRAATLPLSIMGIGKFGGISRLALARSSSVFTYASLGQKRLEGQLSIDQLRVAFDIFGIA